MRVAVTGHRFFDDHAARYITDGVREVLEPLAARGDAHLATSLAEGADQLVARVALSLGMSLDVVVPAAGYAASLHEAYREPYAELLARASTVQVLDYPEPAPEAYLAAGLEVLTGADLLVAVWDGRAERGVGGSAQVVAAARARSVPVVVVWPPDYERP